MSTFTVEQVVGEEAWSGNRGQMVTYELMLQGEDQTVQLIRQSTSQAPSAGDSLDGTIENGSKGRKLKLDYQGAPSGGGSGGSYGGKRDDATHDSIQRQTAAKAAAEMAAAIGGTGPIVLANFEEFFEAVHAKIAAEAGKADAA